MKIYNKFVESKKEPYNKNDIWFDGSAVKIYKEGNWTTITLTKDAIERLVEYANSLHVYLMVEELPEIGEENKIYILKTSTEENSIELIEYIWDGEWKNIGNFNSIELDLNDYLKKEDSPFEKGSAENSAVLKGEYQEYSNKAISQTSMAIGAATTAGLKGWYYSKIDFTNKKITLSDRPTYIIAGSVLLNGGWLSGIPNIKKGDVISIINNSKYDSCAQVNDVNGNVITVSNLPFTELVRDDGALITVPAGQFSDGYSIYIPDKPDAGIIDFGGGAFSEGGQSKASNICAHAEGLQTHAYGQYSHAEGRETEAGYAAHAEGRETRAKGEQSHAEGRTTIASGNCSHAEGRNTVSPGVNSHAEGEGILEQGVPSLSVGAHGRSSHVEGISTTTGEYNEQTGLWSKGDAAHAEGNLTIASGNHSHAEGSGTHASGWQAHAEGHNTLAKGNRSHAEGSGTEAFNLGEHAQGCFNKSTESNDKSRATQFSIGIGTSKDDRKNAFEVKQNGDVYITGIGGFTGDNSSSAKSVQEVINELVNKLNEITTND
jgi:hypothetical protein